MRLLHTADWHLGRAFHGEDLLPAQAAFLDFLVATVRERQIDAVLVAGDLYDRALPPADAVRLAGEALARLAELAPTIVISGNHDSAARLGFLAPLLARGGLHVRTDPRAIGEAIPVGDGRVVAIPYLEPDLVRGTLGVEERTHAAAIGAAMARVPAGAGPLVVMAHAFVAGAQPSESERDLAVGGASSVPASLFAGVDYVALGHLHGPQIVGEHARYAGSPLAFSFSEAHQRKSVAVVEVRAGAAADVQLLPCPVPRPLATLRGTLDELLADPRLAVREQAWVQATLTDPVRPADAMERLRRRFPHAVALVFDPQGAPVPGDSYRRLRGLDDDALVQRFVADTRGKDADEDELALLRDALTARRVAASVA